MDPERVPNTQKTSLLFTLQNQVGSLTEVLGLVKSQGLDMTKIESRPSALPDSYDFFVDIKILSENDQKNLSALIDQLKKNNLVTDVNVVSSEKMVKTEVPWFPRKISDLDEFSHKVLECGSELEADHPGFKDEAYRERRKHITQIATAYKYGERIPRIDYTPEEIATWGVVYKGLKQLFPTHACRQHRHIFPLLERECGYSETNIPQLQDISDFLLGCTGWRLRPVTGLLSPRDFLNGLAFRVFHSTQYIRHHSKPLYTPEPDICHELLGHVPLFADPSFADFSQEIGLASLGASDEDIKKLSTCYWFTVEFGLCKEGDSVRAYGAGLLSSFGELEYCLSSKPEVRPFDPFEAAGREYPITTYQPVYYVAQSFESAKIKMKQFARTLNRPFSVYYNPYTQRVEVLDSKEKIVKIAESITSSMDNLTHCLSKLSNF